MEGLGYGKGPLIPDRPVELARTRAAWLAQAPPVYACFSLSLLVAVGGNFFPFSKPWLPAQLFSLSTAQHLTQHGPPIAAIAPPFP